MPDFCSSSASLGSSASRVCGEMMLAWSTMRPLSGGKVSAKAAMVRPSAAKRLLDVPTEAPSAERRDLVSTISRFWLSQRSLDCATLRAAPLGTTSHFPNFTCGGFCASSLAVNSAIGLLPRIIAQIWPGKVLISVL